MQAPLATAGWLLAIAAWLTGAGRVWVLATRCKPLRPLRVQSKAARLASYIDPVQQFDPTRLGEENRASL